jgi:outer membrane receptor protein involved in Fe transport
LDVYVADMERLEVLEGPQGTLFGAGAQAGVVRYITNKPKLDVTEGNVSAGYGYTSHGDPNSDVQAVLNLPLVAGALAVRAVIYDDARGGYINNVPSTFTRQPTDLGIHYAGYGGGVPPNSLVINNDNEVGNAINPVTYQGFRLSALWKINENWDALLAQSYQNMSAQGVFFQMPRGSEGQPLPDLSVTLFNPSYDKDKFENTALTVNGMIGDLKAVYSGGYLVRNIQQSTDYTNYSRGPRNATRRARPGTSRSAPLIKAMNCGSVRRMAGGSAAWSALSGRTSRSTIRPISTTRRCLPVRTR